MVKPGPSAAAYFDLPAYLTELGSTDLIDLDVAAQLEGDDLLLTGYVETFIEREQLIALTEVVPGIDGGKCNATLYSSAGNLHRCRR